MHHIRHISAFHQFSSSRMEKYFSYKGNVTVCSMPCHVWPLILYYWYILSCCIWILKSIFLFREMCQCVLCPAGGEAGCLQWFGWLAVRLVLTWLDGFLKQCSSNTQVRSRLFKMPSGRGRTKNLAGLHQCFDLQWIKSQDALFGTQN